MMSQKTNTYVLQLEGGKYYVGRTDGVPEKRILQHFTGSGAAWTSMHRPLKVMEIQQGGDRYDEDKLVKKYMAKYGVNNVRGGSYCKVNLPDHELQSIERELRSVQDVCFKCGQPGHFASGCKSQRQTPHTHQAPQQASRATQQFVRPAAPSPAYHQPSYSSGPSMGFSSGRNPVPPLLCERTMPVRPLINQSSYCSRCGRASHTAGDCFAKTDVSGNPLQETRAPSGYKENDVCYRCGRTSHFANDCYAKTDIDGRLL